MKYRQPPRNEADCTSDVSWTYKIQKVKKVKNRKEVRKKAPDGWVGGAAQWMDDGWTMDDSGYKER